MLFAYSLICTGLAGLTFAAAPACSSAYGAQNETLTVAAQNTTGYTSQSAQELGMYSLHIGTYEGFGEIIPDALEPLFPLFNDTARLLRQAKIKCNTCRTKDGKLKYKPYDKPVVPYQSLDFIMYLCSSIVDSLLEKYCDVEGFTPKEAPKPDILEYIQSTYKLFGVGPKIGQKAGVSDAPAGVVIPYYNCLATYGSKSKIQEFEATWFELNQKLSHLYSTDCVKKS